MRPAPNKITHPTIPAAAIEKKLNAGSNAFQKVYTLTNLHVTYYAMQTTYLNTEY